jgi:hypothetical protein
MQFVGLVVGKPELISIDGDRCVLAGQNQYQEKD